MEEAKRNNKKILIPAMISLIVLILAIVMGRTLSFFAVNKQDSGTISGTVASGSLSIEVSKILPTSTYTSKKLIPQLDSAITSAVKGTVSPCIDDNENAVCNVYKIEVTNNGGPTKVWGNIELNNSTSPNLKWASINTNSDTNPTTVSLNGVVNSSSVTTLVEEESYTTGETKTYYVVVWISETGLIQTDSGEYTGTVTFTTAVSPSKAMLTKLNLTSNGELSMPITAVETSNAGIFEMQDDLGTSYYFRGAATNNYVKFGKWKTDWYNYRDNNYIYYGTSTNCSGQKDCAQIASAGDDMYWRIVRINGDGTIRMIYDGTQAYANATGSSDTVLSSSNGLNRSIGKSAFNRNFTDNAYVGYMYGVAEASTYNQTHANTNNSTIKAYIDNWYQTQLSGTTYESNIADAIYCNDRTLNSGTGIGILDTDYGFYGRRTNPTLICEQTNDQFTLTTSDKGNKKLTYPVGLITVDEVVLAGGNVLENFNYYLETGTWYWSGAPYGFDSGRASVWIVYDRGNVSDVYVQNAGAARPLVSLSSSTNFTGSGTLSDSFVISNNG